VADDDDDDDEVVVVVVVVGMVPRNQTYDSTC
jgi:hypothetical protein